MPAFNLADYEIAVQQVLDAKASTLGYDSCLSACSYKDSSVPQFAADAARFIAWRDACWAHCLTALADAESSGVWPELGDYLLTLPGF